MKPVAVFRHVPAEGPGFLATFLDSRSIPWQLIRVDAGETVPVTADSFSGLAFMGGPMSVNDDLPWIASELSLIRDAVKKDIPVLGHCLGGQLMAKALGGTVSRSTVKEIGWGEVSVADHAVAERWFGPLRQFEAFHWHGEVFTVPAHAALLLSTPYCKNQAFALNHHLALQCHVEMTEPMVRHWCEIGAAEIGASTGPAVQSPQAMQKDLPRRVSTLNEVAYRLYDRWVSNLQERQPR